LIQIISITIIIGKTALFEPQHSLEDSAIFEQVFASLDFARIIYFTEQGHQPCTNPQSGGPGPCIYVPH
jgi:hypothetical protein